MARTASELNKSEAIRAAFTELPKAKPKDIVAYLKQQGIEVSVGLAYTVKATMKKKPGRKPGQVSQAKAATPAKAVSPSSNGHLGVGATILLVKSTAEKVGGWDALKEIVEALA